MNVKINKKMFKTQYNFLLSKLREIIITKQRFYYDFFIQSLNNHLAFILFKKFFISDLFSRLQ